MVIAKRKKHFFGGGCYNFFGLFLIYNPRIIDSFASIYGAGTPIDGGP